MSSQYIPVPLVIRANDERHYGAAITIKVESFLYRHNVQSIHHPVIWNPKMNLLDPLRKNSPESRRNEAQKFKSPSNELNSRWNTLVLGLLSTLLDGM